MRFLRRLLLSLYAAITLLLMTCARDATTALLF